MKREFSKLVLGGVMLLYFSGAVFGGFVVANEPSMLGELLAYIGAPTATAIGFYAWKAKAENVCKITKNVEQDNKISSATKNKLINSMAKVFSEIETEDYNDGR